MWIVIWLSCVEHFLKKHNFGSSTKSCFCISCLIKGNYLGGRKASLAGKRLKGLQISLFWNHSLDLMLDWRFFSFNSLPQPGSFFLFSSLGSILPFQHPVPFTPPFYFLEKRKIKEKGKKQLCSSGISTVTEYVKAKKQRAGMEPEEKWV